MPLAEFLAIPPLVPVVIHERAEAGACQVVQAMTNDGGVGVVSSGVDIGKEARNSDSGKDTNRHFRREPARSRKVEASALGATREIDVKKTNADRISAS